MIKYIQNILLLLVFSTLICYSETNQSDLQTHLKIVKKAMKTKDYHLALDELVKAGQSINNETSLKLQVDIQMSYGLLMMETSRRSESARHYEKAYILAKQLDNELWQIRSLTSLAQVAGNDYESAVKWLNIAEDITQDDFLLAEVSATRALIASWHENYQEAIDSGQQAFNVLKQSRKYRKMALAAISASAFGQLKTQQYDMALEAYNQIIPMSYKLGHWQSVHSAYCNRANALIQLGHYQLAKDDLFQAINGLEQERATIPWTNATRSAYLQKQISAYDDLILLLADEDKPLEALKIVERFQAKSFLNLMNTESINHVYGVDNELLQKQGKLIQKLTQLRNSDNDTNEVEQLRLADQLLTLQTTLEKTHPKYYQISHINPIDIESVQFQLESSQAIISYWVSQDRTLIWFITSENITMRQIPVSLQQLQYTIEKWINPIKNNALADELQLTNQVQGHIDDGNKLYQWLFNSIEGLMSNIDHIIIVPDSNLQNLPFESLISHCDGGLVDYYNCQYLGLEKAISYNDSMTSWINLTQRQVVDNNSMLAYAANENRVSNLPATLLEIEHIKAIYPKGKYQVKTEATEQSFKQLANSYSILHLASHGVLDNNIPMNSGLQFVESSTEDGFLSAYEILNLKLNAKITILSACQSGDGKLIQGAGITGLSQAFLTAGSNSVLVSRWQIADKPTSEFMNYFYKAYNQSNSIVESLLIARQKLFNSTRIQQLAFKQKITRYSHPSYWSGFRLNGLGD